MIRFNPKTGRWSDELPSRLCSWLAGPGKIGGAVPLSPLVVTRVGSALSSSTNPTTSTALPALTGPGLLVASIGGNSSGPDNGTWSGGSLTWVPVVAAPGSSGKYCFMAYAVIAASLGAGATVSFTQTSGGNQNSSIMTVDFITGVATASPVDVSNVAQGNSAAPLVSFTTTNAEDVILSYCRGNTVTWGGSMTSLGNVSNNGSSAYKAKSGTGADSADASMTSTTWVIGAIAFKRA